MYKPFFMVDYSPFSGRRGDILREGACGIAGSGYSFFSRPSNLKNPSRMVIGCGGQPGI